MIQGYPEELRAYTTKTGDLKDPGVSEDALNNLLLICLRQVCHPTGPIQPNSALTDAYIRVDRKLPSYDPARGKFKRYVKGICRHVVQELETKHFELWDRERLAGAAIQQICDEAKWQLDVETVNLSDVTDHSLAIALKLASDEDRAILDLIANQGMTPKEAAAVLKWPVSRIYTRLSRLRKKVIEQLDI